MSTTTDTSTTLADKITALRAVADAPIYAAHIHRDEVRIQGRASDGLREYCEERGFFWSGGVAAWKDAPRYDRWVLVVDGVRIVASVEAAR